MLERAMSSGCFTEEEKCVFSTLNAIARYESPDSGIWPQSIKTLKRNLDELYEGGSAKFRRDVAELLGQNRKQLVTESRPASIEDAVMDMTARYADLLQRCNRLSATSAEVADELRRHLERYGGAHALRVVK